MSGDGLVTGKHGIFILSCSEEDGYASRLRNVMVRIMRIPTWILTRRDDKSMSRMREILFWMNEQMRRRLAFPQVTCCFGLAVALEDAFALVTMEIIMLHRTLAKTSSQFTYLCTYNVRYVHPHIQTEGAGRWLRFRAARPVRGRRGQNYNYHLPNCRQERGWGAQLRTRRCLSNVY